MGNELRGVQVPDASAYWTAMIRCQDACPVHTDACGYVNAIAEGRDADAYRIARATNPFASVCGRVCGAPCEASCRRGAIDHPVAIRALKRFVTEQFGPESGASDWYHSANDDRMLPPERGTFERVAVVGAGVSGLTVAHDLTRVGYRVTVFEAHDKPGGMLTAGVPIFRLPRELVSAEIGAILSMGVELRTNMRLGRDFTVESLRREGYKAVFLGIGLPRGRTLQIPGSEAPNVHDGLEFLRQFNEGTPLPIGRRIIVIGGGNVAYDVARSAVRPMAAVGGGDSKAERARDQQTAYDVARSVLRLSGDKDVHIACLEQRHDMPADEREIVEGEDEGIHLHAGWGPQEVMTSNGRAVALRLVKCLSVFDASGRFSPTFDSTQTVDVEADTILYAIGQTSDLSFLQPGDGIESSRGLIRVDPETYQTTAPDVFACGDIAHGPKLFIDAIRSAHIAARSMHDFLRGTRTDVVVRRRWTPALYAMAEGWEARGRREPPLLDEAHRVASVDIVEENYPERTAREQAARCLRCNVNTVFDTDLCLGCRGCVDVCPQQIIRFTGLGDLVTDSEWADRAAAHFGVPATDVAAMDREALNQLGAVMLKDETSCIRCGLCASRCPTHAITMQRFDHYRECVTVNAPNPHLRHEALVP